VAKTAPAPKTPKGTVNTNEQDSAGPSSTTVPPPAPAGVPPLETTIPQLDLAQSLYDDEKLTEKEFKQIRAKLLMEKFGI